VHSAVANAKIAALPVPVIQNQLMVYSILAVTAIVTWKAKGGEFIDLLLTFGFVVNGEIGIIEFIMHRLLRCFRRNEQLWIQRTQDPNFVV
jgi:hypothetical protein